ncbi:MAG: glycosyl transferase [Lachnospiraceae bacterium]|nr:glycosyl transferase [Lachnospiraceae bacterium]
MLEYFRKIGRYCFDRDYRFIINSSMGLYKTMPDDVFLDKMMRGRLGNDSNIIKPISFNEKIQWLKLYDRKPIYTTLVDKYEVKDYVSKMLGSQYVIPTLGVWKRFSDIDFDTLPSAFVLKCTHDSGSVVIVRNKSTMDLKAIEKKLTRCLKRNFYYAGREWPYKNVPPRIIAEKMIAENQEDIKDYKLMCFNGKVKCLFVCSERFSKTGLKVTFFDPEWNRLPFERHYPSSDIRIPRPDNLDSMITIAEKLSKDIPFVRVDLYDCDGTIYFGEMTFYPGSGFEEFNPPEWDEILGSWIELPKRSV